MLLIDAELRNSDIHGIGLFCRETLQKGTKVWSFNPLFDLVIDETAISALPPAVLKFMQMYAYRARETRELIINIDLAKHMNHSEVPTLVCDQDSNYFTAEDLQAGTELTCDYREFAIEGCSAFLDQRHDYSAPTADNEVFVPQPRVKR